MACGEPSLDGIVKEHHSLRRARRKGAPADLGLGPGTSDPPPG
jgi:hypothetical protein